MHSLKEMLMNELYEYEERAKKAPNSKVSPQELDKIHKLTDTVKNICKINMLEEDEGYSESADWMGEGRMYGTSYARGRRGNVRRDSMGRYSRESGYSEEGNMSSQGGSSYGGGSSYRGGYSRDGAKEHLIKKAEEMMNIAESEQERKEIKRFIDNLENA